MMHFQQEYNRNVSFLGHYITEFMMSICFITGSVHLDHLVKMFSAGFFFFL